MADRKISVSMRLFDSKGQLNLVISHARGRADDLTCYERMVWILKNIDENNVECYHSLWLLTMYFLRGQFYDEAERFFRVLMKHTAETTDPNDKYTTYTLCTHFHKTWKAGEILQHMLKWDFVPNDENIKEIREFGDGGIKEVLESYLDNLNKINGSAKSARMRK
jgi:hypothetical protein